MLKQATWSETTEEFNAKASGPVRSHERLVNKYRQLCSRANKEFERRRRELREISEEGRRTQIRETSQMIYNEIRCLNR